MRVVKAIAVLLTIWMIVVFTDQNSGEKFKLTFFGRVIGDTSVTEALLGAFLLGIAVAGAYSLYNYQKLAKKYKEILSDNEQLEKDLTALRMMSIEDGRDTHTTSSRE